MSYQQTGINLGIFKIYMKSFLSHKKLQSNITPQNFRLLFKQENPCFRGKQVGLFAYLLTNHFTSSG